MNRKNIVIIHMVLFLCAIEIFAQNSIQREKLIFEKNIDLYRKGDYKNAEQNFALIISNLSNSTLITANYLMLVKSQYQLGDYVVTIEHCKKFLRIFPQSSYRDDVLYVMGNSYYQLSRFRTATKTWINSLEISDDPRLEAKLEKLIKGVVLYKLNDKDIDNLLADVSPSEDGQLFVNIAWSEKEFIQGLTSSAQARLMKSLKLFPNSKYIDRANFLLMSNGNQYSINDRFALLLPLSGMNEEIGKAILEGSQMALDEYNEQHKLNLKIVTKDYGEEVIKAISYFEGLAQNQNLLGVMGPVENDITAACAALTKYVHLPFFSPTATGNGLTNFSDYFTQLNSTIDVSAEIIARYAIDSLKITRFATFAPIDDHFVKMVNKFVETVEDAGAEIIIQEWYYPGDQDFYKQFMKVKRVGLKLAFTDSLIQKFKEVTPTELDSLYKEYLTLEKEKLEETKTKIDSADIPVTSIEGIFIPIFREDLQFIAPQIAYSNIQAQYLGNNDWYDIEQLNKNKNYINGIIFGTDGYLNEESWDYRRFRNEFRTKFKKTPSIYALVGYDSFRYILQAFNPKLEDMTRNQFLRNLKKLNKHNGIYRTFDINKKRFNQYHQLLKYNYGQIIPLK